MITFTARTQPPPGSNSYFIFEYFFSRPRAMFSKFKVSDYKVSVSVFKVCSDHCLIFMVSFVSKKGGWFAYFPPPRQAAQVSSSDYSNLNTHNSNELGVASDWPPPVCNSGIGSWGSRMLYANNSITLYHYPTRKPPLALLPSPPRLSSCTRVEVLPLRFLDAGNVCVHITLFSCNLIRPTSA